MQTALTASSGKSAKTLGYRFRQALSRYKFLYLMLLPGLAFFLVFSYIPMYGITIAFREFSYRNPFGGDWVGLKYFKEMMQDTQFWVSFKNTLQISLGRLIFEFPAPIILALLLNEMRGARLKRVYQTVFTFPHFLSWVVIAGIWKSFLAPNADGALNLIRSWFGLAPVDLLTSKGAIRWVLFFCEGWRSIGWDSIIYFTAIMGINPDLYEAAALDGANRWNIVVHIILPALLVPMTTMFILNLGFFMSAGFDQVYNFSNSAVLSVIDILDTYINRVGIESAQYSVATAVSLVKGGVGCILVLITHVTSKKLTGEGVW